MNITYCEENRLFTLENENITYQMDVLSDGHLRHLYFGKSILGGNSSQVYIPLKTHPVVYSEDEKGYKYCPELTCQEYSGYNTGDYRTSCLNIRYENGATASNLVFHSYKIFDGKNAIKGLPSTYFDKNKVKSLEITLVDKASGIKVALNYSIAEGLDTIIRSARIINGTNAAVYLESALSCCLDMYDDGYELVHFDGRDLFERDFCRTKIQKGRFSVGSECGISSHSANPFVILCRPDTTERQGECYGVSLLYSGNFCVTAELSYAEQTRLTMGINPEKFCWKLSAGEEFFTPETVICYSGDGFGKMSRTLHKLYRENLCRGYYKNHRRPVLINSWEAFVYNIDSDKLVSLAEESAKFGIEMLVLDDGWFGKRDNDDCSLGDWYPNEQKLNGTLSELAYRINNEGLKFGLWIEPEMISEKSELYKNHPDWCISLPDRKPLQSRNQFVLDMSRSEIQDYIFDTFSRILDSANIEYIKWDMNRPLLDVYSNGLVPECQGEVSHRFMLGTYSVLERLTEKYPDVLFESCASGGGRFDAGMLYYTPQIWCSDNTEPSDRAFIQYNTSFGYPMSAISAHISPSPNRQTGRNSTFKTRGIVAMTGSFGYELDIKDIPEYEKNMIKEQISFYKENYEILSSGDYYRLSSPYNSNVVAWQYLANDGSKALVSVFWKRFIVNPKPFNIKLEGLCADADYSVVFDTVNPFCDVDFGEYSGYEYSKLNIQKIKGSVLMNCGINLPYFKRDSVAFMFEVKKLEV